MYEYAEIIGYKHTIKGTELHIVIPKKSIGDKLGKYGSEGAVPVELRIDDGREISNKQRRAIFALFKDMMHHTGDDIIELFKQQMQISFMAETGQELLSLSNCSMTVANEFITYLLKICFKFDIRLSKDTLRLSDDIDLYMYLSVVYRKCAACGIDGASIHHCTGSRIGMGNDRKRLSDIGRYILPLCPRCHSKIHTMPEKKFYELEHVSPLLITEHNYKELNVREGDFFKDDAEKFYSTS